MVANMETADKGKAIAAGNERVLRARLADARFFWDQDRKRTLNSRVKNLDGVVFHDRLGSLGEKVKRMEELAGQIASHPPLTARMVKTLLRQSQGAGLHDFLDNCAALQAICHTTEDHMEAVGALLDKREPKYKGL